MKDILQIVNNNNWLLTIIIMFSVIMSGWGILVIVRFMERLFGHDNKRGPKSDIKKYAGYIFDACSLVILSVSIWFLSVAVLGKFSNSTLGNTINPSLDVATSISVFFAMLTFTISQYFQIKKARQQKENDREKDREQKEADRKKDREQKEADRKKDREQKEADRKKDSIIRTRKAVEDALMRIKAEIDKFQEVLIKCSGELYICEQKLEVLKSANNQDATINNTKILDAENDFKSSFNSMIDLYVFYLSILPDKLQREFTIAINFMPKDMGDKVRKRLETEIIRLTNQISLSQSNVKQFSCGYWNVDNENKIIKRKNNQVLLKEALDLIRHSMITPNSKEHQGIELKSDFVSLDEFFFTMQNYLITMIKLVEESNSENKDVKKLLKELLDSFGVQEPNDEAKRKLLNIHDKLEAKGKKDYDIELYIAFFSLDPKEIAELKTGALKDPLKDALNNGANPNISYNEILKKYQYLTNLLHIQTKLSASNEKDYDVELLLALLYNDQKIVNEAINHMARTDLTEREIVISYKVLFNTQEKKQSEMKYTSEEQTNATLSKFIKIQKELKDQRKTDYDVELFIAAITNNIEKVKDAIKHGADPNITDNQLFAKYRAILNAPEEEPSKQETSSVLDFDRAGSEDVKEIKSEEQANPRLIKFIKIQKALKAQGKTDYDVELFIAAITDNIEKVKDAIDHGADPNITDNQLFAKYRAILNAPEEEPSNPSLIKFIKIQKALKAQGKTDYEVEIFIAAITGDIEKVKNAIKHGANPNITDTQIFDKYRAILDAPEVEPSKQDNSPVQD